MLVLASASPRRRELLAQAGYEFAVRPAHIPEDPLPDEDPIAYVVRLAREKAEAVFRELAAVRQFTETAKTFDEGTERETSGAKAHEDSAAVAARLKSCPDTMPGRTADLHSRFDHAELTGPGMSSQSDRLLDGERLVVLGADTTVTIDGVILGKPVDAADAARMLRLLSGRTHRVITGVALATAASTEVAAEVTAVRFLTLSEEEISAYVATCEPLDKAGAYAIQGRAARWIPRVEGCYFNVVGLPLALVSTLLESIDHGAGRWPASSWLHK